MTPNPGTIPRVLSFATSSLSSARIPAATCLPSIIFAVISFSTVLTRHQYFRHPDDILRNQDRLENHANEHWPASCSHDSSAIRLVIQDQGNERTALAVRRRRPARAVPVSERGNSSAAGGSLQDNFLSVVGEVLAVGTRQGYVRSQAIVARNAAKSEVLTRTRYRPGSRTIPGGNV